MKIPNLDFSSELSFEINSFLANSDHDSGGKEIHGIHFSLKQIEALILISSKVSRTLRFTPIKITLIDDDFREKLLFTGILIRRKNNSTRLEDRFWRLKDFLDENGLEWERLSFIK